ncbi:hypothetical protein POM88_030442 [Heracleum sosnowskyi]|uniref:AIPP2-like SPOC-like domain-containing protein n=1 Tax=Heracleum sosnowskyi TaxID=360622 RepID=A0AAD8HWV7_9APIA|nr:hypothetical protein POM88_030442 [Heracleum sosnowskyi]
MEWTCWYFLLKFFPKIILRELRDICGKGVEALTTCAKCKSGVEHHYCLRNRSRPSKSVSSGVELAMKNLYAENAVHTVEGTFPTNCSTDASWMITFRLKDERTTSIYLGAHPASHAPAKLKQFSEEMPKVLEFECCSYEDFLRTVFKGCDPDEEDIGLYFFPDNVNRSDEYSFLLEQLSGQFFLRSCIDEVDLLLFSSKVLQKDNSEWYKHDFLWGMFRHCHGKLRSAMEGTVVEDMEIDMLGGNIVGTVDVVIPKQSLDSNSAKIPRDFDLNDVPPVPRDFDLNDVLPESTSNSSSSKVPRIDSDMNDVPSVRNDD